MAMQTLSCTVPVVQARPLRPDKGGSEKSATDKHRERRLKKRQKRLKLSERKLREKLISKFRPGLGNKHSTRLLNRKLANRREEEERVDNSLRSSSQFFARLQEEVRQEVKVRQVDKATGHRNSRTNFGQKYKL